MRHGLSAVTVVCFLTIACSRKEEAPRGHPPLSSKVAMRDVVFHSSALGRDMRYRVILPASIAPQQRLPVVYLLHGAGGGFRDWSNNSQVARFAEDNLVLVMPQGDYSYYVNAAGRPADRYEDYIVQDLPADVEARVPVAPGRENRAIAGVSMGGFGAIKIALSHPDLFVFAGGLSSAIDVPRRPFSLKRPSQFWAFRSILGPWGSDARRDRDPFFIARSADPAKAPYLFLTCGDSEGLLRINREFAEVLAEQHLRYEFHAVPGRHEWKQWNQQLPGLFERLTASISRSNNPPGHNGSGPSPSDSSHPPN